MTERDEQQRNSMEEDMKARTVAAFPRLDAPAAGATTDPPATADDPSADDPGPADDPAGAEAPLTEAPLMEAPVAPVLPVGVDSSAVTDLHDVGDQSVATATTATGEEPTDASPVTATDQPTAHKSYDAGRTRIVAAVAGLVILALIAGVVITRLQLNHKNATTRAGATAVAAAKIYAVDLASYDYRHLAQDFGAVQQHSSPTFAKSFIQSSDALKTVLTKYKATAKAKVVAAGLTSGSTDRAVVLVFLDQTVTNTAQKSGPTTDQSRVSITLTRAHAAWVIDQVRLL